MCTVFILGIRTSQRLTMLILKLEQVQFTTGTWRMLMQKKPCLIPMMSETYNV